jgi:hypothetical protein
MVPAELVLRGVTVLTDARPQLRDLFDKLLAAHYFQIGFASDWVTSH